LRLTAIEDNTKIREERILNLEARLDEAQVEIQALKKQLREVDKTVNNTKDSLEFIQGEHDDLVERVANCENEQSTCWDELTHLNIYSRRWNLIFYRVNESKDEDCFSLVRDVLTRNLNLPQDEVSNMKLCGAHRFGKPNRNRARPLIARFTFRADRDRVWKARYRLKNSRISMGEDLPKHIQEIRKNVLIPAMKKIKQETPSHKASVIGDKLAVNGKVYFDHDVPKKWLPVNSSVNTHEDYGNELKNQLEDFAQENIIIAGDFNCALSENDKKGGNPVWKKSIVIKEVQHLANLYNLTDVWRDRNPNDNRFTWRNKSLKSNAD
ncbi:unnamed protein product, partial [Porites lobata]